MLIIRVKYEKILFKDKVRSINNKNIINSFLYETIVLVLFVFNLPFYLNFS